VSREGQGAVELIWEEQNATYVFGGMDPETFTPMAPQLHINIMASMLEKKLHFSYHHRFTRVPSKIVFTQ